MKRKCIILTALICFGFSWPIMAESPNPFFSNTTEKVTKQNSPKNFFKENIRLKKIYGTLGNLQRSYNKKITALISSYREQKSVMLLFYVFLFAVTYGFFHAMMPGHGKNVILGWILSSPKAFHKILLTAASGMVMHVFSAIIMVYGIWFVIGGRISTQSTTFTRYFSYFAFLILCYLALKQLWVVFRRKKQDCLHNMDHISGTTSIKECLITAVSIGIVPCPVSTVLIVFMISHGFHLEGLLTGGFFAIGMAGTLLIYSIIIWLLRSVLIHKQTPVFRRIFDVGLPVLGSLLLIFSGFTFILPYI